MYANDPIVTEDWDEPPRPVTRLVSSRPTRLTMDERLSELGRLKTAVREGPDAEATRRQHGKGKLTARERIELLFDEGSFTEVEPLRRHRATGFGLETRRPHTDGVVTGWGTVHGRTVFVYAHDFRIFGGALGEAHAEKIHKAHGPGGERRARRSSSLCDGAGARIQEGVTALAGYGGIFQRNVRCSGVIPQISVMLGPVRGRGRVLARAHRFRVHGPRHLADVHHRAGCGPGRDRRAHQPRRAGRRGRARRLSPGWRPSSMTTRRAAWSEVRYLLSLLPANNRELPPAAPAADPVGPAHRDAAASWCPPSPAGPMTCGT